MPGEDGNLILDFLTLRPVLFPYTSLPPGGRESEGSCSMVQVRNAGDLTRAGMREGQGENQLERDERELSDFLAMAGRRKKIIIPGS